MLPEFQLPRGLQLFQKGEKRLAYLSLFTHFAKFYFYDFFRLFYEKLSTFYGNLFTSQKRVELFFAVFFLSNEKFA